MLKEVVRLYLLGSGMKLARVDIRFFSYISYQPTVFSMFAFVLYRTEKGIRRNFHMSVNVSAVPTGKVGKVQISPYNDNILDTELR